MASKILLADDSITIQKVVNLTFADEGIDVITVSNGEMAERRLSEINPDLVLADIFMPGKNGYELCQFIKDTPPFQNIPVVLLVGAFEPFDQSEARRVRADGHLTKPFESRTLVETVRKLIQTSRSKAPAKQSPAKQPQPIRDTRPLSPEPELQRDAFIDISQIVGEGSPQTSPQNGAPMAGSVQEAPAAVISGADPLGVDYHGLWEIGTGSEPSVESHGGIPSDVTFGIDLGNGQAPHDAQPTPLFSPGFEISTPQEPQLESQPATSGFEFGFPEPPSDNQPEAQVTQSAESEPAAIPFPQTNGAELSTGFAVPSLFSESRQDEVLDFRQVDAPEPPAPANEVSFELSAVPAESPEPAVDLKAPSSPDGKYFDLIPQESAAAAPKPEAIKWTDRSESPSGESAEAVESGFDLGGMAPTPDPGPSLVEEEPLGDVFSQDKPASAAGQETSFAIAEEAVTVEVRPPSSESFRMVLPPAQESEYAGAWPQLGPDQSMGSFSSLTNTEDTGGGSTGVNETPLGTDFISETSSERSFAISEVGAPESPFDPMELRADEPTEAATTTPIQNDFLQKPAEEFTSSLMWSEEPQPPASSTPVVEPVPVHEPSIQVLAPEAESIGAGLVTQWAEASAPSVEGETGHGSHEIIAEPVPASDIVQSSFAASDGAAAAPEAASLPGTVNLPPGVIDEIVRRVMLEMSDAVVRELAWEILPDCVERVVEKLSRESLAKKI